MSGNLHLSAADGGFLAALRRLTETIRVGLCKLNQIEFDAPWNPRQRGC
jgi:hypothetical protein